MLSSVANIFRIPDLRKKVLVTLALVVVFRLGTFVPLPGVNTAEVRRISESLYKGDSVQQLNALVDLLLNYNRFMESKTSIKPMIKVPEPEENKQAGVGPAGAAE